MERYLTEDKIERAKAFAKVNAKGNIYIAKLIKKIYFHYIGTPMTNENGAALPMYDLNLVKKYYMEELQERMMEIKKIASTNVYTLVLGPYDGAICPISYIKGNYNFWGYANSLIISKHENLKLFFEKKYITEEQRSQLNRWIVSALENKNVDIELKAIENVCSKHLY